jgi:hypothetical protein
VTTVNSQNGGQRKGTGADLISASSESHLRVRSICPPNEGLPGGWVSASPGASPNWSHPIQSITHRDSRYEPDHSAGEGTSTLVQHHFGTVLSMVG